MDEVQKDKSFDTIEGKRLDAVKELIEIKSKRSFEGFEELEKIEEKLNKIKSLLIEIKEMCGIIFNHETQSTLSKEPLAPQLPAMLFQRFS